MFYINQLCTSSFPIGLVKTECRFIVRSVKTGLGRWTLAVAVISVDAYPWGPDLSPWGYENRCYLVALWSLIVRRLSLEVVTKRLLYQQIKYWGSFSAMFTYWSVSLQVFPVMWIFLRSLGVICSDRWVLSEGHKNYFKDWCLMNSQLIFQFLANLNLMNYGHIIKSM